MLYAHYPLHLGEYAAVIEAVLPFEVARDGDSLAYVAEVAPTAYVEGACAHPPANGFHVCHFFLYGSIGFLPEPGDGTHAGGVHLADGVLYGLGVGVDVDTDSAVEGEVGPGFLEDVA